MKIVGGTYREVCQHPRWNALFGSGLRAAAALSKLSPGTELHTYGPETWREDITASAGAFRLNAVVHPSPDEITFHYFHPLSRVMIQPPHRQTAAAFTVEGDVVLRFGFLEGDAIVHARAAVYDPQTGVAPPRFRDNGSAVDRLAVVLNEWEAELATGVRGEAAGPAMLEREEVEVAIIKLGPRGAMVHQAGKAPVLVPPYRTEKVFKIGSGDVFSAAFAHYWAERGLDPVSAADAASRSAAHFVSGPNLPLPDVDGLKVGPPMIAGSSSRKVYLAGPFFHLSQRWLIDETLDCLERLDLEVFSPLHEVGTGGGATRIATADLAGLNECGVVLALLDGIDPGTVFETGHATATGKRIVGLAERVEPYQLTMLEGTGARITRDFTTALYMAAWEAWEA